MITMRDRFRCVKSNGSVEKKEVVEVKEVRTQQNAANAIVLEVIEGPRLGHQLTCGKYFVEEYFEKVAN